MVKAKRRAAIEEVASDNDEDCVAVDAKNDNMPVKVDCPNYVIEKAKSSRAECKRCDKKILKDSIRVGIILEGDWGLFTRWQHLECTIFNKEIAGADAIDGYRELDANSKADVSKRLQASKSEVDEEFIPVDPDEMVRKSWEKPCEPTSNLLIPLLPYQKEGLGWMLHQELTDVHGGILADEMGMGKTIQAISLILYNRPNLEDKEQMNQWNLADQQHEAGETKSKDSTVVALPESKPTKGKKGSSSTTSKASKEIVVSLTTTPRAGTLIVLPTVAIRQWQTEIARFTDPGALTVQVYHGSDRNTDVQDLRKTDVVITSYKVLEIEYRKATAGLKVTCKLCGKKFYPEKLRVHRKFFCGETAQRSDAQMKTQKKNDKKSSSTVGAKDEDDDDEEDVEEEDEVDKQKRMIKNMRKGETKPSAKGKDKKVTPSKKKKNGKASKSIESDDSGGEGSDGDSDGDVVPAKKNDRNKKKAAATAVVVDGKKGRQAKAAATKSIKLKASKAKLSDSSDNDSDFSDDDNSSSEEDNENDNLASGDDSVVAKVTKKPAAKKRKLSKASKAREEEQQESGDEVDKQKRMIKKLKADKDAEKGKKTNKLSKKNKKKTDSESEELEDEGDSDESQVERDIADAIRKNAQAQRGAAPKQSILHLVSWFRIILDEAHMIKDRSTSTAKAVFNLKSLNKWCLTGTPLQNRVGELYSLIRFLRIDPHAFYYCKSKQCTCKSLHYRFTQGRCDDCSHSVMLHYCHFNKHILNPIKRSGYVGDGRKAMLKLKQQVLDEVLLRRTKTSRAEDIQLPGRVVRVRQERMDEKEEDFYQALYTQSQAQFNTYLMSGTVLNNYAHIFDILIRLRQAVDHPYLVIYSDTQSTSAESKANFNSTTSNSKSNEEEEEEDAICSLCHEPTEDEVRAGCGHRFCRSCLTDFMATIETVAVSSATTSEEGGSSAKRSDKKSKKIGSDGLCCPDCKKPLTVDLLQQQVSNLESGPNSLSVWDASKRRKKSILDKVNLANFQSSTKLEALMEELYKMQEMDPGAKAIVFSQFVNMLDILEYRVQRGGVGCVKMLGHMNLQQRDNVIKSFKEDPDVKVFLISLKAGGVALNLTVASRIFIMDPWWNPAAEMQAIDRTHRIGQFKPIFATRFIIENSIEERILKLQEKKKLVFDGTVGGDSGSMSKLTVDDMRFLFQ